MPLISQFTFHSPNLQTRWKSTVLPRQATPLHSLALSRCVLMQLPESQKSQLRLSLGVMSVIKYVLIQEELVRG